VDYTSPHFRMVQYLGLRGYPSTSAARLQQQYLQLGGQA